jgi:predicted dehydrogenase
MATSIHDCVNMLRDVTSPPMKGKVFAIGHVMRYSPYNQAVRKVIDSGVLGEIVDVQVRNPPLPVLMAAHGTCWESAFRPLVRPRKLGQ